MSHPYFQDAPYPRVLAHRGLRPDDTVAENSYASVAAAQQAGAVFVESDCHLTRDGEVVLFHDGDLRRVTGDPRRLVDVDLTELTALMADRGGLITLRSALADFPDVRFNLDVKAPAAAEAVGALVADHGERVLVTSFADARRRAALASASRHAPAGAAAPATSAGRETIARVLWGLTARNPRIIASALAGVDALQVPERQGPVRVVTPRLIDAAHRHGVEVHVWTVNDPAEIRRLVAMGVDGIVTDSADVAIATLRTASDPG